MTSNVSAYASVASIIIIDALARLAFVFLNDGTRFDAPSVVRFARAIVLIDAVIVILPIFVRRTRNPFRRRASCLRIYDNKYTTTIRSTKVIRAKYKYQVSKRNQLNGNEHFFIYPECNRYPPCKGLAPITNNDNIRKFGCI